MKKCHLNDKPIPNFLLGLKEFVSFSPSRHSSGHTNLVSYVPTHTHTVLPYFQLRSNKCSDKWINSNLKYNTSSRKVSSDRVLLRLVTRF